MSKSIWSDEVTMPLFDPLQKNVKTDVLIIGGGICGILCAYFLEQMGVNYLLVEADSIGSGVTKNTTAKITSLHGLIYHQLLLDAGREKAKMYLDANELAVKKFCALSAKIDCDFETTNAYTYSLKDRNRIEDEVRAVNSLGFHANYTEFLPLPFETKGAICFENQAQFQPMKFLAAISQGLKICEHTFIKEIHKNEAISEHYKITADKIIVASHYPFIDRRGNYYLKIYQHRSYIIALKNCENVHGMYVDEAQKGLSFRNYKDLLLLGGGSHRTGKHGGNWNELREFTSRFYPEAIEKYCWAAQDCMTLDSVPYIGAYSKSTPSLYVATGFNKWGITSSMVAAMILSDMVLGKKNDFEPVFNPHRSILKSQLFLNLGETLVNFATPTLKRCPHLGCALKWNPVEHSWDCPCHGSRFEEDGKLIDDPAIRDAKTGPPNL